MHGQSHATSVIRELGHPRETNSNFHEEKHKTCKAVYRATSKRKTDGAYMREIVR